MDNNIFSRSNLLPHEKIDLDTEFRAVHQPPPGEEFPRLPSPPPSRHSSQDGPEEDPDDHKKKGKRWEGKKQQKTQEEYAKVRNENVMAYLKQLKKKPPFAKKQILASLREDKLEKFKKLTATSSSKEQESSDNSNGEIVCHSETDRESDSSFSRNGAITFGNFEEQCFQTDMDHRLELFRKEGTLTEGVSFNHNVFQMILEAEWELLKVKRMIQIYEGVQLGCKLDSRWMMGVEDEIQTIYGPMDTKSEWFAKIVDAFKLQRMEGTIKMCEEENEMLERMIKEKKCPSDYPENLAAFRKIQADLEEKIEAMTELKCDQNPYTNLECMDFWVMPRPQETIAVYKSRKQEMENFVECNLPLEKIGLPIEEEDETISKGQVADDEEESKSLKLFIREGYNPAVFDVGWNYSTKKIYGDCSWRQFYPEGVVMKNPTILRKQLLKLRGELMTYHPFGVEANQFYKNFREKYNIPEETSLFGELEDPVGIHVLSDLFFAQELTGENSTKFIFFDSLFEGLISPPQTMLLRLWMRIRFLIDERPHQLLPLERVKGIYENYFGQTFLPLQWGFKDVEEFVRNAHQYLPNEETEDVIVVTKDKTEVEKMSKAFDDEKNVEEAQKQMDKEWADIVGHIGGDDGDEKWCKYFNGDQEFIQDGPWLPDGAVYRVLDD